MYHLGGSYLKGKSFLAALLDSRIAHDVVLASLHSGYFPSERIGHQNSNSFLSMALKSEHYKSDSDGGCAPPFEACLNEASYVNKTEELFQKLKPLKLFFYKEEDKYVEMSSKHLRRGAKVLLVSERMLPTTDVDEVVGGFLYADDLPLGSSVRSGYEEVGRAPYCSFLFGPRISVLRDLRYRGTPALSFGEGTPSVPTMVAYHGRLEANVETHHEKLESSMVGILAQQFYSACLREPTVLIDLAAMFPDFTSVLPSFERGDFDFRAFSLRFLSESRRRSQTDPTFADRLSKISNLTAICASVGFLPLFREDTRIPSVGSTIFKDYFEWVVSGLLCGDYGDVASLALNHGRAILDSLYSYILTAGISGGGYLAYGLATKALATIARINRSDFFAIWPTMEARDKLTDPLLANDVRPALSGDVFTEPDLDDLFLSQRGLAVTTRNGGLGKRNTQFGMYKVFRDVSDKTSYHLSLGESMWSLRGFFYDPKIGEPVLKEIETGHYASGAGMDCSFEDLRLDDAQKWACGLDGPFDTRLEVQSYVPTMAPAPTSGPAFEVRRDTGPSLDFYERMQL